MNPTIEQVMIIAELMDDLMDEVVLVGGCAAALLVDEAARPTARMTEDVDLVLEVVARNEYYSFAKEMRKRGFAEDTDAGAPICRWITRLSSTRVVVDLMPTRPEIFGFANRWYPQVHAESSTVTLPNGLDIRMAGPLYFLATKFSAWSERGGGDLFHKDIQDIVFVLENRTPFVAEFTQAANDGLKQFLALESWVLLQHPRLANDLPGHASPGGVKLVIDALRVMADYSDYKE